MSRQLFILCLTVALFAAVQAKSACEEQKEKEALKTGPLKLDVKCLPNGDYAPLQCFPTTKKCYCASPDGNQLTQPNANRKFCKCELEKAKVMKKLNLNGRPIDPPNGTWMPSCSRDGLFMLKQCESGTNKCWCVNQEGVQLSKEKKVGDVNCSRT